MIEADQVRLRDALRKAATSPKAADAGYMSKTGAEVWRHHSYDFAAMAEREDLSTLIRVIETTAMFGGGGLNGFISQLKKEYPAP